MKLHSIIAANQPSCPPTQPASNIESAPHNSRSPKASVVVFARNPEAGKCKTRLIPALGEQGALQTYVALTKHTLQWATAVATSGIARVEIRLHGGCPSRYAEEFGLQSSIDAQLLQIREQGEGDLGQKLLRAVIDQQRQGHEQTILVGTDCPDLSADFAQAASQRLNSHQLCLSPATDGGYNLIGLNLGQLKQEDCAALFEHIDWGTDRVLGQTLKAVSSINASVSLLPVTADVDRPEDVPLWREKQASSADCPGLSVIIPVHGTEPGLPQVIDSAQAPATEILLVGTAVSGELIDLALAKQVQFLQAEANRSRQLNLGARVARADTLLFLHADTRLPSNYQHELQSCLSKPGVVAGAFQLHIDSSAIGARWVEKGVAWRSTWRQMPYGDQAIFLKRARFEQLGGFPDQAIMEDFALMRKLRQQGKIALCPSSVSTSARRWHQLGFLRTTWINQLMILGYRAGIAPEKLARFYRRQGSTSRRS